MVFWGSQDPFKFSDCPEGLTKLEGRLYLQIKLTIVKDRVKQQERYFHSAEWGVRVIKEIWVCCVPWRNVVQWHYMQEGLTWSGKLGRMFLRRYKLRSENNVEDNHARWGESFQEEATIRVKILGQREQLLHLNVGHSVNPLKCPTQWIHPISEISLYYQKQISGILGILSGKQILFQGKEVVWIVLWSYCLQFRFCGTWSLYILGVLFKTTNTDDG